LEFFVFYNLKDLIKFFYFLILILYFILFFADSAPCFHTLRLQALSNLRQNSKEHTIQVAINCHRPDISDQLVSFIASAAEMQQLLASIIRRALI
jgi:hypothetical protein